MSVVTSVIDASLAAVLHEMLHQSKALEDDSPGTGTLGLDVFPHDASDNGKFLIIKGIASNLIHNTGGSAPILVA